MCILRIRFLLEVVSGHSPRSSFLWQFRCVVPLTYPPAFNSKDGARQTQQKVWITVNMRSVCQRI